MADNPSLKPFQNSDGSTSYAGQVNAGQWEKAQGYQPSAQQSNESWSAYTTRLNAGKG